MAKLKDVAKLANVSIATASRILNNDQTLSVTKETREAVLNAAEELHYAVKQKNSKIVFAIILWYSIDEELSDPYYLSLRKGVENFLKAHQVAVKRIFSDDINMFNALEDVSGIICLGKFSIEYIYRLKNVCDNLILLDMDLHPCTETCIVLDFESAVKQVVSYFHSSKIKKAGFLGGIEYIDGKPYNDPRRLYFEKYCQEFGIDYQNYIQESQFTREGGYQMMTNLILSHQVPEAIFAASDRIAIGALRALHDHHFHVPQDISIVGFDNIESTNFTVPPLTTVHAPAYEMGYLGAQLLYNSILNNEILPAMRIQLPCYFIERESSKQLNKS